MPTDETPAKREPDDFRLLLEGEITSQEYVRRLDERVNGDRERNRPWRQWPVEPADAARDGFWSGLRSLFGWWR